MLQSKTYYSYDERGNLSGEQTRTYASEGLAGSTAEQAGLSNDANSVKTYHYDRFNRLVEYTDGDTVAKYEYNADNLRTAKTVNGRRTDYVWDGTNLRYETGGNGTHTYAYDPTGVHMMDGNYYVKDGHGNVTGMYDANAEFVSDTYYDAFGNITYGDAPNPFGYSGEYHDSETGLIYLRNRYYDSSTGRFITEDPAKDGVNWYSYCGGDPVNMVDPWGLWMEGDENLSDAAQLYTKYYGQQWETANEKYENATTEADRVKAQQEKDYWHGQAEDIRELDKQGKVTGAFYNVQLFKQSFYNLCWAFCQVMVEDYMTGGGMTEIEAIKRANTIATSVYGSGKDPITGKAAWNQGGWPTNSIDVVQQIPNLQTINSVSDIHAILKNAPAYGYYNNAAQATSQNVKAHLVVITGVASAPGHTDIVSSNNPMGGKNIQTYADFISGFPGDTDNMRFVGALRTI